MYLINRFVVSFIIILPSECLIPSYLEECYKNSSVSGPQLPLNFQVFIDIIRKIEKYSETSMNIRTLSSSILHRFKFDGIVYQEDLDVGENIAFSGSGPQRAKDELIKELISGNPKTIPTESLTLYERCTLHFALSNTIWEHRSPETDKFCLERPKEKISEKIQPEKRKCLLERGVILTPYGTVAPGILVAAIAAATQPQNVAIKLLLNVTNQFDYNEDQVDLVIPKHLMNFGKSMWFTSIMNSETELDNIWFSSVAGELAEMVVYQGPLVRSEMTLGATGSWNSTMRPRIFYLLDNIDFVDVTRAEIVGAIDAFIIAMNLKSWIANYNLRLSQVLSMYYSSKGPPFDSNVKACSRGRTFWYVASKTVLEEQVFAASKLLAFRRSIAYMNDRALKKMVNYSISKFKNYANRQLFPEILCVRETRRPQVELIVAFDGAWSRDYTADFLSVLIEDADVSMFGSKIAMLNGEIGDWILNATNSPSSAHEIIANFSSIPWPKKLNLSAILDQIELYLIHSWDDRLRNQTVGYLGQVVVILAPLFQLNSFELSEVVSRLSSFKSQFPDVYFIYYVSQSNSESFRNLLINEKDRLFEDSKIDYVTDYLMNIPRSLRIDLCNQNQSESDRKNQVEDYVEPFSSIVYRIDPHWRQKLKSYEMKIISVGYGNLEVCSWIQRKGISVKEMLICREVSGHSELKIINYSECIHENCSGLYYQIRGLSSLTKCAEFDCKAPNFIRYIIRLESFDCSSSSIIFNNLYIHFLILILFLYM